MTGKELEKIYNEAYKAVYWTAMSLLKNEADAEDIVQDTFVSFMESYSDLTDTTKATALLKKIAANKCLDRIKLAKTDNMDEEFFDNVEAIPEDFLPDSIVESDEMRRIVMDIINNSLSEDVRRTLILFYFDEMSTKEIAEALDVPQGTVLRRLNFARNKIKKEVEKYEEENDTKLFGMAIPFLSKLFIKESEQVIFKPMPASFSNLSASTEASKAGTKLAKTAIEKGTDIMKTKILIGSVAAVVAVGATVGIIIGVASKKHDTKPETTKVTRESENYTSDDDESEGVVTTNTSSSDVDDEDVIPAGYLSHNELADILNSVPPDEWCSGWTTTAENDYWRVESKPMYVRKIGQMMGLKYIEPIVVFKITNISGETYNISGGCTSTDTESKPNSSGVDVDVAPGETVYRCIAISANAITDGEGTRYVFDTARIVFNTWDPKTFEAPRKDGTCRLYFDVDFTKVEKLDF